MSAIVHFGVPAEDTGRAKKFYSSLFDWKFESYPRMEYYLISTTNLDGTPGVGGGMGYLANCIDTEGNFFGLWEENKEAK